MTIVEFLRARIAEDEALAAHRPAEVADWSTWGPDRTLVECAIKERIVREFEERDQDVDLMLGPDVLRQREWAGLFLAMKLLALPYETHPDYRLVEWRP